MKCGKCAYSLAEVIFAIGLLALCLFVLMGVMISSLKLSGQNSEAVQAQQFAQQLLEKSRPPTLISATSQIYDGRQSNPPINGFPPAPYPSAQVAGQDYKFLVRVEPETTPKLVSVHVTVFYGDSHQVDLESSIFQP